MQLPEQQYFKMMVDGQPAVVNSTRTLWVGLLVGHIWAIYVYTASVAWGNVHLQVQLATPL